MLLSRHGLLQMIDPAEISLLFVPYFTGHALVLTFSIKLDSHNLTVLLSERVTKTVRPKQTRATTNIAIWVLIHRVLIYINSLIYIPKMHRFDNAISLEQFASILFCQKKGVLDRTFAGKNSILC